MATDIHRLKLGYAPGAPSGPATLIAKLPSSIAEVRAVARGWGLYQREVLFYRDIAPTVALRIPRSYVAEFDVDTHRFVLVMEDLSPARSADQISGLSLEHTRLALDEIASLHARWWNRPELTTLEAAIQPFGEGAWRGTGVLAHAARLAHLRQVQGRPGLAGTAPGRRADGVRGRTDDGRHGQGPEDPLPR